MKRKKKTTHNNKQQEPKAKKQTSNKGMYFHSPNLILRYNIIAWSCLAGEQLRSVGSRFCIAACPWAGVINDLLVRLGPVGA